MIVKIFAFPTTYLSYAIFTKVIIIFNLLCYYLLILLKLSSLVTVAMVTWDGSRASQPNNLLKTSHFPKFQC